MTIAPKEMLDFFSKYIHSQLGIVYTETNYYQLDSRLTDIAKQLGFATLEEFWTEARRGIAGAMKQLILDIATNNETSFFRDPIAFKAIRTILLQEQQNNRIPEGGLRIWSAACSSGQEVYSLAMLLGEMPTLSFRLTASDVSDRVLKKAQAGEYSQLEIQRGLNALEILKHFDQKASGDASVWSIKSSLRKNIQFEKRNLLEKWTSLGQFDLVLCRNVLIYQSVENKKKVVEQILEHLAPGGYFLMGAGESLLGISDRFELQTIEGAVFYKKKSA